MVPNAYEPILEQYLGQEVAIESLIGDKIFEHVPTLQEYSSQFILVRNVHLADQLPPQVQGQPYSMEQYDVAFPRHSHLIRHLASRHQA